MNAGGNNAAGNITVLRPMLMGRFFRNPNNNPLIKKDYDHERASLYI